MGILSLLKGESPKCNWCGENTHGDEHFKRVGSKTYEFCSRQCKKEFRKAGLGRVNTCPTCNIK